MIATTETNLGLALSPVGQLALSAQPVLNVREYLATRRLQPLVAGEESLFITLPIDQRRNIRALLAAFEVVQAATARASVSAGCRKALAVFGTRWTPARFRAQYDQWVKAGDWTVLVNKCKTDIASGWRERNMGLPETFLDFVAQRFAEFKRNDAKRQALMSIKRQWKTGRNDFGRPEAIPGYGFWQDWVKAHRPGELFATAPIPAGWGYNNILTQIKARSKFTEPVRLLLHDGESAARGLLPQVIGTRKGLRFLEKITFDDVRVDWLVRNPATGKSEELWLLLARCEATAMVLGFVMLPASIREDGKATHLGAQQMKQLAGYILETYPLPPYVSSWKVERGTATLAEGVKAALGELSGGRVAVSYTSMIGAESSPAGYREKKKGNSRGKASHESHNRLIHTQGAYIPAQTGNRWDIRPADLVARTAEAEQIWTLAQKLPEHLRGEAQYPILTPAQAREHLFRICIDQNFRDDHRLEDFDEVLEWRDPVDGQIKPAYCAPPGAELLKRMERPVERARRHMTDLSGWTFVSRDVIVAFYEHTERKVTVEDNGEIKFRMNGQDVIFQHGGIPLDPGTKLLGYCHPDDPQYLHLTDGNGAIKGTWIQRTRVPFKDQELLAQAMRYTHAAISAVKAEADKLAAPQRAELEAMRAHNAELAAPFITVTEAPEGNCGEINTPVNAALTAISEVRKESRAKQQRAAERAAEEILTPRPEGESAPESNDEFWKAMSVKT